MLLSVRAKVLSLVAVFTLILLAFMGLSFQMVLNSNADLKLYDEFASDADKALAIRFNVIQVWEIIDDAALMRDPSRVDSEVKAYLDESTAAVKALEESAARRAESIEGQDIIDEFTAFVDSGRALVEAYTSSWEEGMEAMAAFDEIGEDLVEDTKALAEAMKARAEGGKTALRERLDRQLALVVIFGFVAAGLAWVAAFIITRSLVRNIRTVHKVVHELATSEGDLTRTVDVKSRDELGDLGRSMNLFIDKLKDILVTVTDFANRNRSLGTQLAGSARETAQAVSQMAERLEVMWKEIGALDTEAEHASAAMVQIRSAVENLVTQVDTQFDAIARSSSAIEEIMASVDSVARIAQSRTEVMKDLVELIQSGGEKVQTTTAIIKDIAHNAEDMLGMVDLIDNISTQTHLLAMNASIEAAHAGEAGKGFAVVADEIRKLAEGTGSNAAQIAQSLRATEEKIREASTAGAESEDALIQINQEVVNFANALQEVTSSMSELSLAGAEILHSIETLVGTSETVRTGSQEMRISADRVGSTIATVKATSTQNLEEVSVLMHLGKSLNRSSLLVSAFGNQNNYNNAALHGELSRINTGTAPAVVEKDKLIGIDWSDILALNIAAMDDEHKELFIRINDLLRALLNDDLGNIRALVARVSEYIDYHFDDEERLMAEYQYPDLAAHHKLHEQYKAEFRAIDERLEKEGFNALVLIDIQDKVVTWLLEHIARVDKKYSAFMDQADHREKAGAFKPAKS